MKAIVITGEGARGAFQAGVIRSIYSDVKPDSVYGISSGAVNALALSYMSPDELCDMWSGFDSISDVFSFNTFSFFYKNGLYNSKPVIDIAKRFVTEENKKPVCSVIARVDAYVGKIEYLYTKYSYDDETIISFLRDAVTISGLVEPRDPRFVDAGAVELNPLTRAIEDGAKEVHLVMGSRLDAPKFKPRTGFFPAVDYAIRSLMVTLHVMIIDDIKRALARDDVKLKVYMPKVELPPQLAFDRSSEMVFMGKHQHEVKEW